MDAGYAAPFLHPLPRDLPTDHTVSVGTARYVLSPKDAEGRSRLTLHREGAAATGISSIPLRGDRRIRRRHRGSRHLSGQKRRRVASSLLDVVQCFECTVRGFALYGVQEFAHRLQALSLYLCRRINPDRRRQLSWLRQIGLCRGERLLPSSPTS